MSFKPSFFLRNRHIQTLYAPLFRKPKLRNLEFEKFILSDSDFVELAWRDKPKKVSTKPIVVLFHGLGGSYKSVYISNMMCALKREGFSSVLMHFRGAGESENLSPKSYHGCATSEALEFLESLRKEYPLSKIFAIGFSIGGNMLLNLLAQHRENSFLSGAIAISAPMQLDSSAHFINRGFSRFYQFIILKELRRILLQKVQRFQIFNLQKSDIENFKSFLEFDEAYTAPIHGFTCAKEYYKKCSAKQYLNQILTPTLIVHAKDDPFMSHDAIPSQEELSGHITFELHENGGHMGFIHGSVFKPQYYLEQRVVEYLSAFVEE